LPNKTKEYYGTTLFMGVYIA